MGGISGSPVRRNRPEAKEANGPGAVHADDKPVSTAKKIYLPQFSTSYLVF